MTKDKFVRKLYINRQIESLNEEMTGMFEDHEDLTFSNEEIVDCSKVLQKTYLSIEEKLLEDGMSTDAAQGNLTLIVVKTLLDKFICAQPMLDDDKYFDTLHEVKFSESEIVIGIEHLVEAFLIVEKKRITKESSIEPILGAHEIIVLSALLEKMQEARDTY